MGEINSLLAFTALVAAYSAYCTQGSFPTWLPGVLVLGFLVSSTVSVSIY